MEMFLPNVWRTYAFLSAPYLRWWKGVKKIGEDAGIIFDDIGSAPVRTGGHVPRVGRVLHDNLHVKSARDIFSIPDLTQFYDQLPEAVAQALQRQLEAYRSSVGGQFLKLFNFIAALLNDSDDLRSTLF